MIQINAGDRWSGRRVGSSRTGAEDRHAPRPLLPFRAHALRPHRPARNLRHGRVIAATSKAGAWTCAPLRVLERSAYAGANLFGRRPMIRIRVDLGMLDRYPSDRLPDLAGRGRIGRRLAAVGHRPDCLGIGIEEYTAFRCEGCNARAIGSGGVMIVDASWASHSNAADAGPGDILSLHAATLHELGSGDCFDRPHAAPQDGLCRRLSTPRCAPRRDNANRVRRLSLNIAGPPTHRRDARASGSRCRRAQRRAR